VRPVRDEKGRVRFRAMNAEKGVSPGTLELDPRSEEDQENIPRPAPKPTAPQPEPPAKPAPQTEAAPKSEEPDVQVGA
jgi:hypothetical protein